MPNVGMELYRQKQSKIAGLRQDRLPWWEHWRELADYYLPRRYRWLLSAQENTRIKGKNPYILDPTGTHAARILASGMMNGITSPSRPWFKLRIAGFDFETDYAARVWLDEVTRRMQLVLSESNFYNALAVMYLDLSVFGTSSMLIYDDLDKVIHCYVPALGEYYLAQDPRMRVNTFARQFTYQVHQCVDEFGIENVSETVAQLYRQKGANWHKSVTVNHLIEPNVGPAGVQLPKSFQYREYYWENAGPTEDGKMLAVKGYNELPLIAPRWELFANDSYGSSPAMDALADVVQLQHETKKKGQGLDKLVSPPIIADIQLEHKPTAFMANGITFVANSANVGAKAVYTVNPPLAEMTADIREVQARIRQAFHNDLFQMISQLETVRSATEIDARREEKLVLLGPVLERFENEALDPALNRVFNVMMRRGLLPEIPPELEGAEIEIQYVSILSSAQSAVGTIPTERWLQLIGQTAAVYPGALDLPDFDGLLRDYARDVGVPQKNVRSTDAIQSLREKRMQEEQNQQMLDAAQPLTESAKNLSQADVGGGANALQRIIGG